MSLRLLHGLVAWAVVLACCLVADAAEDSEGVFRDDFSNGLGRWRQYWEAKQWVVADGVLQNEGKSAESVLLATFPSAADVVMEADVRIADSGRLNFGLVLRAERALTFLLIGYHDRSNKLELHRYELGIPSKVRAADGKVMFMPGRWYRVKAAAIGDMVLGKMWPVGSDEPGWQLRAPSGDSGAGGVGVMTLDASPVEFANVHVRSGAAIEELKEAWAAERASYEAHLREVLELELDPTPLVLRAPDGPMRRIDLRALANGEPALVDGTLTASFGNANKDYPIRKTDLVKGTYQLLIPEPSDPSELRVKFTTSIGKTVEGRCTVKPAREWTFYMTEHTHYDIGFTAPQPIVIERLSRDMDNVVPFVEETADWPEESRFKWTVEVSGLLRNYVERHSEQEVARLMDLVRQGSVEICGYYLNMPTELVGHEELIRCLYYAREVREKYNVVIDTAMIDDVPGYAWALPEVFVEAGISRAAFRANSIRGQFLWYREGAVPRPFYWESPDGSRLFTWYTDSYREGNFWRQPGLQEEWFIRIIRRNEAAGCWVNDIQLRMGGDNLAPDLDVSRNVRAWNEKYIWPKTVVATNRDFLEALEKRYGHRCQTFRGDIPSWWAEGPASSAMETGINRLGHDRLVSAETLWAAAWLSDPDIDYPRGTINAAYDNMIHFDEHTWGASDAVRAPKSRNTRVQWGLKARYAYTARDLTDELQDDALGRLSRSIAAPGAHSVAVWNTLAWPRTDVVELSLLDTPFAGVSRLAVTDARTGEAVPAQVTDDGTTAVFVARDLPPVGYAVFTVARTSAEPPESPQPPERTLENEFYRIELSKELDGIASWHDKQLNRELLDAKADFRGNQALHEKPIGGRIAIGRKKPVEFERTASMSGTMVQRVSGRVFQQLTFKTSLPGCPEIRQTVRLYNDLKLVDISNVVAKDEIVEPEGVYFAFPFDVPTPTIRFQIADAVMQPGKDQLALTCHDFYSIQQWADVAGDGFGIVFAPLEAPLVVPSDLNVYKWADKLTFDKGHLYSLALNNYWFTNFRAVQSGQIPSRYRLTSYAGGHDPIRATQFAWQPFYPPLTSWLTADGRGTWPVAGSLIRAEGDPVVISCIKVAESGDAIIVRLLEMRGQPSRCKLTFTLPVRRQVTRAYAATVLEEPGQSLPVSGNAVTVELRPNEIFTVGVVPGPGGT